jgi:hypothetical protein
MTVLAHTLGKARRLLRLPVAGWIGMELGLDWIRAAQLEYEGGCWRLTQGWSGGLFDALAQADAQTTQAATAKSDVPLEPQVAIRHLLDRFGNAQGLFRHRSAGLVLGDGLVDYRELDLPSGTSDESPEILSAEIAADYDVTIEELVIESWELMNLSRARAAMPSFATATVAREFGLWLGGELLRHELEPQLWDAMPCCQARAGKIFLGEVSHPYLMIDIGERCTTLTLVMEAVPVLTRVLHSLGIRELLQPIAADFQLSVEEARSLLLFRRPSPEVSVAADEISLGLKNHQTRFLRELAEEIQQTAHYLQYSVGSLRPEEIVVTGSGTIVPKVAAELESLTRIPTACWEVGAGSGWCDTLPVGVYAIAASLSALAWEV